jgi:hypothetical protein
MKSFICGCARNSGKFLPKVFNNIKIIAELFEDYHIVIAYDNSDDNTYEILQEYKSLYGEKMQILLNPNQLTLSRTQNISNARNTLIDYVYNPSNPNYEYFIMMDMDDVCSGQINIDALKYNLSRTDWDSVSFNRNFYYDIWALSIDPFYISCWHWSKEWIHGTPYFAILMKSFIEQSIAATSKMELLDCKSAFNGFAIYRKSKFENCVYKNSFIENLEFLSYNEIENNNRVFNRYDKSIKFIWTHVDDDCEHKHFHFQAIEKNKAKIKISPLILFEENIE